MSDSDLPRTNPSESDEQPPEVRLELTRAGVQEVLSLYSREQRGFETDPGFSLRFADIERAIRERRRMLLWGAVGGLALGILVWALSPALYPVSAQVVIERHDGSGRESSLGPGGGGSAFVATQAEVLQSDSVIAAAVEKLPRAAHLDADDDAVLDAVESVSASPVSGTQVVALGYLGPDADYGVALLGAMLEAYRDVLRRNEVAVQHDKLEAKQGEIEALEAEAAALEGELAQIRRENDVMGTAEETAAAQTSVLQDLAQRLAEARNQRIALENRLAAGDDRLAILDPSVRSLQEQLWAAEAELARVQLSLKPRHPAVEAAQREVTVLRRQLREGSRATPEALKRDIEASLGLEQQLEAAYEAERERMTGIEASRREESLLLAELERVRQLSDARRSELLDQRLLTRMAESGDVGVTTRLIETPRLPKSASWPRPKLILPASLMLGLAAGFVAALVSLRREQTEQLERWEAAPRSAGPGLDLR